MPTFTLNKLVRDKIWAMNEALGFSMRGRRGVAGVELLRELRRKLLEESQELDLDGDPHALASELADIQQVIDDICRTAGVSPEEVDRARQKKLKHKGGFAGGDLIETLTIPDEVSEWVRYYREEPERYPEIKEEKA